MISAKIDYLTISLLPDQSGWTISEALSCCGIVRLWLYP